MPCHRCDSAASYIYYIDGIIGPHVWLSGSIELFFQVYNSENCYGGNISIIWYLEYPEAIELVLVSKEKEKKKRRGTVSRISGYRYIYDLKVQ